jgi:SM-20-related protein
MMHQTESLIENLCTHGYHIVDQFLPKSICLDLLAIAKRTQGQGYFNNAKIGQKLEHNKVIRTDKIFWLDQLSQDPAITTYLNTVNELKTLLNEQLYLSLVEFETHFSIYPPGTFYKKHVDQFAEKKTRKISCVYYLNEDWSASSGGTLQLYSPNQQLLNEVLPQANRFICFNSELPHEVSITKCFRYSIAGWMKTRP